MAVATFNYPKFKYTIASTGQPGVGYKLFTYEEATSTKKTTWTSRSKTAANTNPIILDANGEADVWIDGNYKFVLAPPTDTDPPTSPVWTYDGVRSEDSTTASTASGEAIPINGSFEDDTDSDGVPDNWTVAPYTGGTVALDTTTSTHGETSLKFTSTGSGGGTASTNDYYEVEAGKTVGVRFSIISDDVDTLNKVEVQWYDSSQLYLSSSFAYNDGATNPTSWTRKYTNVTAPATAKYARIILTGVDPSSTTHSNTSFDNVSLDTTFTGEITQDISEINSDLELKATSFTHNMASDADYTLSTAENDYGRIIITDTGVVLTTGRNIIVSTTERTFLAQNDTAQTLTYKTAAGTGVAVVAGESTILACDGTNVVGTLDAYYTKAEITTLTQGLLHVQDQKASGTSGGSSSIGVNTRTLNTVVTNEISGASLSTNQITLPAGTYEIVASAPALEANAHRAYLYNVTDAADEVLGTSEYNTGANKNSTSSVVRGRFTIASTKVFELRHYINLNQATYGLGEAVTVAGQVEIYSDVLINKIS